MRLAALFLAALTLVGCADWTPEQREQFRQNFNAGLGATQRVYQPAPAYVAPPPAPTTTVCRRSFNNTVVCDTQ